MHGCVGGGRFVIFGGGSVGRGEDYDFESKTSKEPHKTNHTPTTDYAYPLYSYISRPAPAGAGEVTIKEGNATPGAEHPFSAARWAKLNLNTAGSVARLYKDALGAVDAREQELGGIDGQRGGAGRGKLLQLCSHFFQVLDMAIERGVFPKDVREYHHRDKNVARLPKLVTYDALEFGGYIVAGRAERAADEGAGHVAMAMPSAAQVQTALSALQAAMGPHTTRKTALTAAQQVVEVMLPRAAGVR